ncbi:EAL domain-containing protein [Peribacillus asahii]|uniref:EAL domain-containing protein n=1 Tax=Peribacillus asahii TaxID=228899 RepID=UPI0015FBF5A7|nr:EAL domain-containing protein [Peribacillus asahii]
MSKTSNTEIILERISDAFYSLDKDLKFEYINNVTESLLQINRGKAIGQYIYKVLPHSDIQKFVKRYKRALLKQITVEFQEYFNNRWYEIRAFPSAEGLSVFFRDITKQEQEYQKMNYLANYDVLTDLPNRYFFNNYLNDKLQTLEKPIAVVFISMNKIEKVNNTFGHESGDQLIKQTAERLKRIVEPIGFIARYSGDEFLVALEYQDQKEISSIIDKVIESVSNPFLINGFELKTSLSIGISQSPKDGDSVEILMKYAAFAMNRAKKLRGNNSKFYSYNQGEGSIDPLELEMELGKAIDQDQLFLHYQPKINLNTGKIVGVEALIRWEHPEWGLIPPGTFIPIAEETGLIIPIGEWALNVACKQNKIWQERGFKTVVSVNLSAIQFNQPNLIDTIEAVLQKTGLEPHFLEVEITESMTADIESTILMLQHLKKIGVRISIDDFGTGFSSLSYLKYFPVDTLKIDQSFVRKLHNNPNDETIIKAIISMAHNLNLKVVAEGIETKEQLVFLQHHLCDEGQGFFLSKPLLANDLEQKRSRIEQIVEDNGIPGDLNQKLWMKEFYEKAKKELQDTVRLQQGMIFKFKKINDRFIHTLCDGELLYRFGMIPSQIIGKSLEEFLPYENAIEKTTFYNRSWEGEEFVTYEDELNGICYLATLRPLKKGGEVVEVIGSCIDITARKKAEKALKESEFKYRLIADSMTDIIMLLDINGKILYSSPSLANIIGYPLRSFVGESSFDLIHPEDKQSVIMGFQQVIDTITPARMEAHFFTRSGDSVLIEGVGTPVLGKNGEPEYFIVVGRDITEKRITEEQLSKAEKLSIIGQLAAGVAHEVRNPLTSIKGFIKLLEQGSNNKEYFEIISKEFDQIEGILKEFLALAKPQEIQLKKVNIQTIFNDVTILLKSEANLRNVEISQEFQPNLPQVLCDMNQIKQVFINIIKNSIEAIPNGGFVKIEGYVEDGNLLMKIIDNGIGLNKERIKRLGEPYYSNKEKGTGLGLMLCYKIVRQHNGSIIVRSKENHGTTVEVRLPIKSSQ